MELSIMIVDNDQVNSFVLKKIINRHYSQAEVSMYVDGKMALEVLQEKDKQGTPFPNIILLDIYMPFYDGFAFMEDYQEVFSHKESLLFAMSSSLVKEDQQRANSYNVVKGFITKPLIYNNIQFIVETYLNKS